MLLYMLTGVPWQEKQERGDLRKNKYYDMSMNRMIEKKKTTFQWKGVQQALDSLISMQMHNILCFQYPPAV